MLRKIVPIVLAALIAAPAATAQAPSAAQILAASPKSDWRELNPMNTLYMDLDRGRVIIELAPSFAPRHVDNLRRLVSDRYFDGLAILRSQDNYVVQWGDPNDEEPTARPLGGAASKLAPEFTRRDITGVVWTPIPDRDAYARQVGFADGFPAGRDPDSGETWLLHCYGMVAVARGNPADSGSGSQLYAINGHAPRHLDRNMTVVGRVVAGMDILASLPRGTGNLGFYSLPEQRTPINRVRFAAELPENQRIPMEALRTNTDTFARVTEARRNRKDDFFHVSAGGIDVCNVGLPIREPR